LGASHDLLQQSACEGVSLASLVQSQLGHLANLIGARIMLDGPAVALNRTAAQSIGMALHELATNASKYGALSVDTGLVRIAWTCGDQFAIQWVERDGPILVIPSRRGFGSRVLVDMLQYEFEGQAVLEFADTGLIWQFSAPAQNICDGGSRANSFAAS
jgi:two-component sensor histidine kinase